MASRRLKNEASILTPHNFQRISIFSLLLCIFASSQPSSVSVCSWFPRTPFFLTWNVGRLFWSEPPQRTRPSRWTLPCWAGARCWSWRSSQWRRCCRSWIELWPRWGSESWSEIQSPAKIKTKQLKKSKCCPGDPALTDACHDLVLSSRSQSIGLTGRSGLCCTLREIINGMEWFLSSQLELRGLEPEHSSHLWSCLRCWKKRISKSCRQWSSC